MDAGQGGVDGDVRLRSSVDAAGVVTEYGYGSDPVAWVTQFGWWSRYRFWGLTWGFGRGGGVGACI
jgi:hypothetical protein